MKVCAKEKTMKTSNALHFFMSIVLLPLLPFALQGMDTKTTHQGLAQLIKPINEWPHYFYNDAFTGARYDISVSPTRLDREKHTAINLSKENAEKKGLTKDIRKQYDWICSLKLAETQLLKKNIAAWTINDIESLARFLTRLSSNNSGQYSAPQAADELNALLAKIKKNVASVKNPAQRMEYIKKQAINLHVGIAKIKPFAKSNRRLGRLLMNIVFAQYGIKPVTYLSTKSYNKILKKCHEKNDSTYLYLYTRDLIIAEHYTFEINLFNHPLRTTIMDKLSRAPTTVPLARLMLDSPEYSALYKEIEGPIRAKALEQHQALAEKFFSTAS